MNINLDDVVTLALKDGKVYEGKILAKAPTYLTIIDHEYGEIVIPLQDVDTITVIKHEN